jgi:ureidoacrylate peracid hydrolase
VTRPTADRTALIVVDMQNAFCHPDASFTRMGADMSACTAMIPACRRLVDAAHGANVPVVFTQAQWREDYADGGVIFNEIMGGQAQAKALVAGTWDAQMVDELTPEPRDHVIVKNRFSSFYGTQMEPLLRSLRVERLVVCGVTTCMCVESTVRDAAQRDYRVAVPRDGVADVVETMHEAALRSMEYGFASIVTLASIEQAWSAGASLAGEQPNQGSPSFLRRDPVIAD